MKIEKCPFHNIEPEYAVDILREELSMKYTDSSNNENKILVYPRLADYYWYCPECKKSILNNSATGHAMTKLGRGYYSRLSKEKALSNWNTGIINLIPAIIKAAVKGKDI